MTSVDMHATGRLISDSQRRIEESAYARDQSAIATIENLRFFPLSVTSGNGAHLRTSSGRDLIDLSASWTASAWGHGNEHIAEAVSRAARTGAGSSVLSSAVDESTRLAQRLVDIAPVRTPERAYLGLSGSNANSAVVEAVRRATNRPTIVSFSGSYHGGFGASRAVSGLADGAGEDPQASRIVDFPRTEDDCDALRENLGELLAGHSVAAVIAESIQCDGGVRVPPAGFLPLLRELCDATGTLLVIDEVKTGLGRTGELVACAASGILPDLITLGKSLGGGLPISAAIGPASILDESRATALLTTAGSPICAAAANAVLDLLEDPALLGTVRRTGAHARLRLASHSGTCRPGAELIADIRGQGLLLGIEFTSASLPASDIAALASYRAWERGAVVYPVGEGVLELTPPLAITEQELDRGLDAVFEALDDVSSGTVPFEILNRFSGW